MNVLMVSLTVFMTILAAVALGIGFGYVAITAILRAMAHRSAAQPHSAALSTVSTSLGD